MSVWRRRLRDMTIFLFLGAMCLGDSAERFIKFKPPLRRNRTRYANRKGCHNKKNAESSLTATNVVLLVLQNDLLLV